MKLTSSNDTCKTIDYLKRMRFWFYITAMFMFCTWIWNVFALYINIRPPIGETVSNIFHNPSDLFYFAISLYFAIIVKLIYFIIFGKYRKCEEHGLIKTKATSYLFYIGWIILALGIACSWLGFFIAGEANIPQFYILKEQKIGINPVQFISSILMVTGLLLFIFFGKHFKKLNI